MSIHGTGRKMKRHTDTHLMQIIFSNGGRVERVLRNGNHNTWSGSNTMLHHQFHRTLEKKQSKADSNNQ